jgi:hypothetical protein
LKLNDKHEKNSDEKITKALPGHSQRKPVPWNRFHKTGNYGLVEKSRCWNCRSYTDGEANSSEMLVTTYKITQPHKPRLQFNILGEFEVQITVFFFYVCTDKPLYIISCKGTAFMRASCRLSALKVFC